MLTNDTLLWLYASVEEVGEDSHYVVLNVEHEIDNGFITVDYSTHNGTAVAPNDFPSQSGQLTIDTLDGNTAYITISISDDYQYEQDETFTVVLSNPGANVVIMEGTATVTLWDNEDPPEEDDPVICDCDCGCPVMGTSTNQQTGALMLANRASELKYDSVGNPHPIISAKTTLDPTNGAATLTSVEVELDFGGLQAGPVYYDGDGVLANEDYLFSLQVDASSLATGRYAWTMTFTEHYSDSSTVTRVKGGWYEVVNRIDSEFGNRWTPEWLDRLAIQPDGVLEVRGDGNTFWYAELVDGTFARQSGEFGFSTMTRNVNGTYTLERKDGSKSHFSALGLLTSREDRLGNTTTFTYTDADSDSVADEVATMTDPVGRVTTLAYTGGLIDTITDADGGVTTFTHDISGRVTMIEELDPDGAGPLIGHVTEFTYHTGTNLVATMELPSGSITSYTYDFAGRLKTKTNPDTTTTEYEPLQSQALVDTSIGLGSTTNLAPLFLASNLETTTTNELNETTTYLTDRFGFVVSETDALGNTTTYERNAEGLVTTMTQPDPDGAGPLTSPVTTYSYDSRNNLIGMTLPDSSTRSWTYESTFNQVTSYTNELGQVTMYDIDPSNGNVLGITRVVGELDDGFNLETDDVETTFTYYALPTGPNDPPAGLLASETDPLGRLTTYAYDSHGNLTSLTYADGTSLEASVTFEYDADDNLIAFEDELNRRTEYDYDNIGRLIAVTLPDPDGAGSLTAPVTQYQYNSMDRLTKEIDPLGRETTYTYGAFGNIATITQPDPDGAGPLTAPVTTYDYDDAGNLLSMTDPLGRITTYAYDDIGRNTSITLPDPDGAGPLTSPVTEFAFDAIGHLINVEDALDNDTQIQFSSNGLTQTIVSADPDGAGPQVSPETVMAYDAAGNLVSMTDPLLRVTTYAYDDLNRLITVTEPNPGTGSPVTEYEYDKAGNLRFVTDALNNVTEYVYDARNRLIEVIGADPDGVGSLSAPVTEYDYDDAGQLISVTDPLLRVTTYTYDALGRLTATTLPDPDGGGSQTSPVYSTSYDAVGNVLTETDPLSNVTSYQYDRLNRLITMTQPDPDGGGSLTAPATTFTYDAVGNRLTLTDPVGNTTTWTYDGLNRMLTDTNELLDVRSYEYDAVGNLVEMTDRNGRVRQFTYDNLYRRTKETWLNGLSTVNTIEYTFDAASQLTAALDAFSEYAYGYDALGRATTISQLVPGSAANEIQTITVPASIDSGDFTLEFDGEFTAGIAFDASAAAVQSALEDLPNIDPGDVLVTGSSGGPWTAEFKGALAAQDAPLLIVDDSGLSSSFDASVFTDTEGDTGVNEIQMVETFGTTTGAQFTLDFDSEVTAPIPASASATQVEAALEALSGIGVGNVSVSGSAGGPWTIEFTGALSELDVSELVAAVVPPSMSVAATQQGHGSTTLARLTQAFDKLGNRTSLTAEIDGGSGLVDDFLTEYQYDALSRMTRITQQGQTGGNAVAEKRIDLAYNAAGQFTDIDRYADVAGTMLAVGTNYTYDLIGRLTDLVHTQGSTTLADYEWTYDVFSRVTQFVSPDGTSNYSYDATSQLTDADHDYQTDEAYEYDENGNRTMTGYSTGDNNQLLSDGTFNYTYDDEGNRLTLTRISSDPADDHLTEYTWDYRNRLTKVTFKNNAGTLTKELRYTYDLFNRRISKEVDDDGNGVFDRAEQYVYDGDHIALRFVDADGDGSQASSLANRYLHGPVIDQILADEQVTSLLAEGDILWPLADNQGTVRDLAAYDAVLDETTVENHLVFDSFGQITSETNVGIDHQFAYTGREWDPDTGMYYYRARWYDAAAGRFISEDPLGFEAKDTSLYRYVSNATPNSIDPTGLLQFPAHQATEENDGIAVPEIDLTPDFNPFDDGEVGIDGSGDFGPTSFGGGIDVNIWNGASDFWWWLQGNLPFGDDGRLQFQFDANCGTVYFNDPFSDGGGIIVRINTDYDDIFGNGSFDLPINPSWLPGLGGGISIDGTFDSNGDFDFLGGGRIEFDFGPFEGCIEVNGRWSSTPGQSGGTVGGTVTF